MQAELLQDVGLSAWCTWEVASVHVLCQSLHPRLEEAGSGGQGFGPSHTCAVMRLPSRRTHPVRGCSHCRIPVLGEGVGSL